MHRCFFCWRVIVWFALWLKKHFQLLHFSTNNNNGFDLYSPLFSMEVQSALHGVHCSFTPQSHTSGGKHQVATAALGQTWLPNHTNGLPDPHKTFIHQRHVHKVGEVSWPRTQRQKDSVWVGIEAPTLHLPTGQLALPSEPLSPQICYQKSGCNCFHS